MVNSLHGALSISPVIVGEALPLWTHASEELLELECQAFFVNSWQMVRHVYDLQQPGDFLTFDMWRDSVIVVCGKDQVIRAFSP